MGEKKTYIINIDGMRADYFCAIGHQGCLTPTLEKLAEREIRFKNCKDVLPAVTATNHTSILTSTNVGTHGIYGMGAHFQGLDFAHRRISCKHGTAKMAKYEHEHLQGLPTFFNIVKKNNPLSKTAFISGKNWVDFLADDDCDILIYGDNPSNPDYVTSCEGFVLGGERHEKDKRLPPRFYIPKKGVRIVRPPKGTIAVPQNVINTDFIPSDKWIIDQAINTICHHDPDFMYILLSNVDMAGHAYGSFKDEGTSNLMRLINHDAAKDQLYITDSEIKRFIDFLKRRNSYNKSRIIVTSDHGMSTIKEIKKASDIRKTLANHGLKIKANTRWLPYGYDDSGKYDWCFSEGTQVFIYCRKEYEKEIKEAIQKDYPHLYMILDKEDQKRMKLWKDNYDDVVWPRLIVFLDKNYTNVFYGDTVAAGGKMIKKLPFIIQFTIAKIHGMPGIPPGTHGTPADQDVPLIFVSESEHKTGSISLEKNSTVNNNVSVLDIIPTINYLNGWPDQPTFEGKLLF